LYSSSFKYISDVHVYLSFEPRVELYVGQNRLTNNNKYNIWVPTAVTAKGRISKKKRKPSWDMAMGKGSSFML